MIKTLLIFIFNKTPEWIKAPVIFVLTPIATIGAILWFTHFLPWHRESVRAEILPFEERRLLQMSYILENQEKQNKHILDKLERVERSQDIIINNLLGGKK